MEHTKSKSMGGFYRPDVSPCELFEGYMRWDVRVKLGIDWRRRYRRIQSHGTGVVTGVSTYRGRLKGFGQVERMLQASSGRSGKQQQLQNSPNLAEAFLPNPVRSRDSHLSRFCSGFFPIFSPWYWHANSYYPRGLIIRKWNSSKYRAGLKKAVPGCKNFSGKLRQKW